jgi:hypothetical protein
MGILRHQNLKLILAIEPDAIDIAQFANEVALVERNGSVGASNNRAIKIELCR